MPKLVTVHRSCEAEPHPSAQRGGRGGRERRQERLQLQLHRPACRRLPLAQYMSTSSRLQLAVLPTAITSAAALMSHQLKNLSSCRLGGATHTVSITAPPLFAAAATAVSSSAWMGPPATSCGSNGCSGRSASGSPCKELRTIYSMVGYRSQE